MRALRVSVLLTVVAAITSACGGDDTPRGASPSPIATVSPTPTPTSASNIPRTLASGPVFSKDFVTEISSINYDGQIETGIVRQDGRTSVGRRWIDFSYEQATDQFVFQNLNSFREPSQRRFETGSTINSQLSDGTFIRFRNVYDEGPVTSIGDMWLYRYRPDNAEVSNAYSTFGRYREERRSSSNHLNFTDDWFVFGEETARSDMPQRGSIVYSGAVFGNALSPSEGLNYELRGTVRITVNFDDQTADGFIDLSGTAHDGRTISFDRFHLPQSNLGFIYANEVHFELPLTSESGGEVKSLFFGPTAEEVAASFAIRVTDNGGREYRMRGALLAARR